MKDIFISAAAAAAVGALFVGGISIYADSLRIKDAEACWAAGGDLVEQKKHGPPECWDTQAGRRLFDVTRKERK